MNMSIKKFNYLKLEFEYNNKVASQLMRRIHLNQKQISSLKMTVKRINKPKVWGKYTTSANRAPNSTKDGGKDVEYR